MYKLTLLSVLIIFGLMQFTQSCVTSTSWRSTTQCYECTNCGDPFNPSSTLVNTKTCGVGSVSCAVSLNTKFS